MPQDRYTKLVLTLLAVGVWALVLAQIGTPAVLAAAADDASAGDTSLEPVSNEVAVSGAPFASYPLRWYIPFVNHVVENDVLECFTVVGVVNPNTSSINVEIDFLNETGGIQATRSSAVAAGATWGVDTDDMGEYPDTGDVNMYGHARIYADNPNVLPIHLIECPHGHLSMTPFAVGATLDLFRASMPRPGEMPRVDVAER